mmetsp:Transcript_52964/g.123781  ORF Transcript_52964/g.123781 Transcript_52964/m.123781 type:complete len:183 (-) Transcript_52964:511-1059(-)
MVGDDMPDKASPHCVVCMSAFTSVHRRHHCRRCGLLVCGSCSGHKAATGDGRQRVCDGCFNLLSNQSDTPQASPALETSRSIDSDRQDSPQLRSDREELLDGADTKTRAELDFEAEIAAADKEIRANQAAEDAKRELQLRGEKLSKLKESTDRLGGEAESFGDLAKKLAEKERKRSQRWGLF